VIFDIDGTSVDVCQRIHYLQKKPIWDGGLRPLGLLRDIDKDSVGIGELMLAVPAAGD
jgi:hypothetical protein